jgi:2,3-bisphosphoglycerate-independent phosphoglycerate mutase
VKVQAHGTAVGLPSDDDMGNSEVGHNALGCGRVLQQGAALVDAALASEALFKGAGWEHVSQGMSSSTLHLIGLLSDGGVHSRYDQIRGIMMGAVKRGVKKIRVHALLDGRDVPDGSSVKFMQQLEADLKATGVDAKVASGGGRMKVTMDRYESDWDIVKRGWDAHVLGKGERQFESGSEAVEVLRKEGHNDQFLPSFTITQGGQPVGSIQDGDAVVLCNFRGDRAIQISKAFDTFAEEKFAFDRVRVPKVKFAGLMSYDGDTHVPKHFLVNPPLIDRTSGELLANTGIRTFAVSETQKYGHVTYFWNGNRSGTFNSNLEKYEEVLSDKGDFHLAPAMQAEKIALAAERAVLSREFDMIRLNFANGDMVGHTGDLAASIRAVEAVDRQLASLLQALDSVQGRFLVTADHGNCDEMAQRDKKGNVMRDSKGKIMPLTSHTLAPVPVCIGGAGLPEGVALSTEGIKKPGLANITATFINLLGFQAPEYYERSLISLPT